VILLINEQEDEKIIVFTDAAGVRSRLVLGAKAELRVSMSDYDAVRKNKAAAAALDGWKALGAIRVLTIAADPVAPAAA